MNTIDPTLLEYCYHSILELGMENLQRATLPELHDYLRIEIEHLHNIPSYLHSDNLLRHAYYYCSERPLYLERVVETSMSNVGFIIARYTPHWDTLRELLTPFAETINQQDYSEKL